MAKKNQAFVYGWNNIQNKKKYVGFRKSSEINDGYKFSSEDKELKRDWSRGLLHRSILFVGTPEEAIKYESKLLHHFNARTNGQFYNKSNGGGVGCKGWEELSESVIQGGIDWVEKGIEPITESKDTYDVIDTKLVNRIWKNCQEGKYQVVETNIEEIRKFDHNQVRLVLLDPKHVQAIAEKMEDDPAEARTNVSPIIVCVSPDGTRTILDGNHTSRAVDVANWQSAPVIYLNSSEFNDSQSNMDKFGNVANHNPKLKKPNSSRDCQRAITNLWANNFRDNDPNLEILQSEKFKNTCLEVFYPLWSLREIASNYSKAVINVKTDKATADLNFIKYSSKELDAIAKSVRDRNPDLAVITVSSGACYNSGIGGVLNKMGGMDNWNGMLIIHHGNINEYELWTESEAKLHKALKRVHPDCDIKIRILKAFETKQKRVNL